MDPKRIRSRILASVGRVEVDFISVPNRFRVHFYINYLEKITYDLVFSEFESLMRTWVYTGKGNKVVDMAFRLLPLGFLATLEPSNLETFMMMVEHFWLTREIDM